MSNEQAEQEPGEKPEPRLDPPPDQAPGGPADMIQRDDDDLPLATPDQPRSAQVEDSHVPDEIQESEDVDEEEQQDMDDSTKEPS